MKMKNRNLFIVLVLLAMLSVTPLGKAFADSVPPFDVDFAWQDGGDPTEEATEEVPPTAESSVVVEEAPAEESPVVVEEAPVVIEVPSEETPVIIQLPAEEPVEKPFNEQVQDIMVLIAYGLGLAGLAKGLWEVGQILSTYRITANARFMKADAALVPFGQGLYGHFANQNAQRLLAAVDEPNDAIVGQLAQYLNKAANRKLVTPEQVSSILTSVVGAAVELTDGIDISTKPPAG